MGVNDDTQAKSSASEDVFGKATQDDLALENLGYQQEFNRSYSLFDMIGFSFSIVTSWTALSGVFIIGITSGGPPVMLFGWVGVCVLTITVALAMAEMCSRWPVAGGQYTWVSLLAPRKIARPMSYITGWFMLTGILAMGSANNSFAANFTLGQANLVFPSYTIENWHTVLVTYLVALSAAALNIWTPHLLNRIARAILIWNLGSFVIIIIVLLATNTHKQDPSFVFQQFQNTTGFGSAMGTVVGIVQSFFGMCCYDGPSHMTEEMEDASRDAPRAIIAAVGIGAVSGFVFILVLCFCIGDVAGTSNSPTGVPVIQIFFDSTQSKVGTCFLASMIVVIMFVSSVSLTAEGSRALFAFARDRGLPFSGLLARVERRKRIPVVAILVTTVVQMGFNSIYFGPATGFQTIIQIASTGFYASYALALLSRLLGYLSNPQNSTFTGPFAYPLPVSLAINLLGYLFLTFAFITFNFPSEGPVTSDNMNYASAAIGIIALLSLVTWCTTGYRQFGGPGGVEDVVVDGVVGGDAAVEGVRGSEKLEKQEDDDTTSTNG